jgi:hypothetical protein
MTMTEAKAAAPNSSEMAIAIIGPFPSSARPGLATGSACVNPTFEQPMLAQGLYVHYLFYTVKNLLERSAAARLHCGWIFCRRAPKCPSAD